MLDFFGVLAVDRPSYLANMCVLSIWPSPKVPVYGLGEVSGLLADGRETLWYCLLDPGTPVTGRAGIPRSSGMYKSFSSWKNGGLTAMLMTNRPDEKKTAGAPSGSRNTPFACRPDTDP